MPSPVSQLVLFGVGALALAVASSGADAQTCKPGAQISGTTTIEKMTSIKGGVGMTVSSFTDCGLKFVVVPLKVIMDSVAASASCTAGSTLEVSGVTVRRDGTSQLGSKPLPVPVAATLLRMLVVYGMPIGLKGAGGIVGHLSSRNCGRVSPARLQSRQRRSFRLSFATAGDPVGTGLPDGPLSEGTATTNARVEPFAHDFYSGTFQPQSMRLRRFRTATCFRAAADLPSDGCVIGSTSRIYSASASQKLSA